MKEGKINVFLLKQAFQYNRQLFVRVLNELMYPVDNDELLLLIGWNLDSTQDLQFQLTQIMEKLVLSGVVEVDEKGLYFLRPEVELYIKSLQMEQVFQGKRKKIH